MKILTSGRLGAWLWKCRPSNVAERGGGAGEELGRAQCGVGGSYVVRLVGRGGRGRAGSQKGRQAWGGASGQCSEA